MSTRQKITVHCDGGDMKPGGEWPRDVVQCTETFEHDGIQSVPDSRKAAKQAGWSIGRGSGFDYCPAHKHFA